MALSRIDGQDDLYVGGIWALRRSDSLTDRNITHVLSVVSFNTNNMKNFKDEPWSHYGRDFQHLQIDIDDVDDADLLIELPRAVRFIDAGLRTDQSKAAVTGPDGADSLGAVGLEKGVESIDLAKETPNSKSDPDAKSAEKESKGKRKTGGVFVHCAAGKSRSVSATIAYLLWRYPNRFDPNIVGPRRHSVDESQSQTPATTVNRPRRETAREAVRAALDFIRRSRPMAEPNDGFMAQLQLWWEMGCPADKDIEAHPIYQRWAYKREVEETVAVGQAPSRLRFEDEEGGSAASEDASGLSLRCKKCRRTLASGPFIIEHQPADQRTLGRPSVQCPHFFVEPLSWMRPELEKGELNGRLLCPNQSCGASVGRYDWKGFKCSCTGWVTPAFSLQRARVDDIVARKPVSVAAGQQALGIRMPPGSRSGNL